MFKQIRKQKGLEILEYGLIAALVIGGAALLYSNLGTASKNNLEKADLCVRTPADCPAP